MKKILLLFFTVIGTSNLFAQTTENDSLQEKQVTKEPTLEELQQQLAIEKDSLKAAQKRVDDTQKAIDNFPGWKKGTYGVIGGSLSNFDNWYAQRIPNNNSGNFSIVANAYANLNTKYFFWKNFGKLNLAWVKFNDKDKENDNTQWREATDIFNISSLYGQKINEKFALSGLGEYRTTFLINLNNPGYLDAGIGTTWTPKKELVVVVHPLNYNFVFSRQEAIFSSSLGTKILVDYSRKIDKVNFKTNLSMFQSYKSYDLSNLTWINSVSYTLWKGIGIGFDFGLRSNKQEALKYYFDRYNPTSGDPVPAFNNIKNKLQTYYTLGLSYKF